ncbi:MAG: lytic transglycosylase domain-containing protein [Bacteroidetes bacterium]|nr:lytic transglycosylase domain-containing protein [Bacteroidota bacterium]
MLKNKILSSLLAINIFIAGCLFFNFTNEDAIKQESDFRKNYHVHALHLPENFSFAGEKFNFKDAEVAERFDREVMVNTYWQSQTLITLKKIHRWFPVIEPILKENSLPDDFKYLAVAESNLSNAVSPSGAAGFWQFMPAAAREYNLTINTEVDERYHLEKATMAACNYLKQSKQTFGSWMLAAASYNMGVDGVQKALTTQKVTNYDDLLLNEETSRYLFRIAAIKYIYENQRQMGYNLQPYDLYDPYTFQMITVDSSITDLAQFAINQGVNYKKLKLLNPWLRNNSLTNVEKKVYQVKILKEAKTFRMYNDSFFKADSLK